MLNLKHEIRVDGVLKYSRKNQNPLLRLFIYSFRSLEKKTQPRTSYSYHGRQYPETSYFIAQDFNA